MKKFLMLSAALALIMPIAVIVFGNKISSDIIIMFWPSSLVLLSLGSESNFSDIAFTWCFAVGVNIVFYMVLMLLFIWFRILIRRKK